MAAFNDAGPGYPHLFAAQPNSGVPSGQDLDGNGRIGEARDALGYGRFTGDGGLAILSRWPIDEDAVLDLSATLWRDQPDASFPIKEDGTAFYSEASLDVLPISSTAHWRVPVMAPDGPVHLLVWSATPPVFDGPEDANGLRNREELLLWEPFLEGPFVLAGNANLDPVDGAGLTEAMASFLDDPRLIDPLPASLGAEQLADPTHLGDPALDTADWSDDGPGNLRVSYVLPASSWTVEGAGTFWPAPEDPEAALLGSDGMAAGPHHLVWVDIRR